MKHFKNLIIGALLTLAISWLSPTAHAQDICDSISDHYTQIYCTISLDDTEELDEELIETLSEQFDMDEELIEAILDGSICEMVATYSPEQKEDLPQVVQTSCLPSGKSTGQVLGAWTVFDDIQTSYEKEKVIQMSAQKLEFKYKASEQYWNGTLADAPFDLIVDLNLIEIVLFGSKAKWTDDVWSYTSDEESEEEEELPGFDDQIPEDETTTTSTTPDGEDEGGLTTDTDLNNDGEPDCVPPDDPEADLGDGPGSQNENTLCGNGSIDVLMGEQCDDGNTESGDGCNQYCQEEATGANDICIDPDSITFKKPGQAASGGTSGGSADGGGGDSGDECPAGTVPKKGGISGPPAEEPTEVPQYPEYPGPYLGGTLKQAETGERPPCPAGEKYFWDDPTTGEPVCMNPCADPDLLRNLLFGEDWATNESVKDAALAIESYFCVNITEHNRPESPYQTIEGCIDCHISAMTDALSRALEGNVTPLKNTTNAFGTSSAHAPNFAFNLNTATKTKIKYKRTGTIKPNKVPGSENLKKALNENEPKSNANLPPKSAPETLSEETRKLNAAREAVLEDINNFHLSSGVIPDQEINARIKPLLEQMKASFISIQAKYNDMASDAEALADKPECK